MRASRSSPTLRRGRFELLALQRVAQIRAGADVQLREHLAQVPLYGARAQEQSRANLWIREPFAGELGYLTLLRSEIVPGLKRPPADLFSGGQQLSPSWIDHTPARRLTLSGPPASLVDVEVH